jgi:phenylpropionate dioxygenase-like ring-hydroxylating dioxygenase large terminal subunit
MNRATQLAIAQTLHSHARNRTTDRAPAVFRNLVQAYSDPVRAQLERDQLFRTRPNFVAMSCRIPEPGDYLTEEIAGVPILVVRGADRTVKAFANICRHRGAPVATGCGHARAFSCPYHGWTYALDGKLAGVPELASFGELDREQHGLQRLPLGERYGFIFVRVTPPSTDESFDIDVDDYLCGLQSDFAAYGFERYSFFAAETMTPKINWKFGVDTFLESYHLPSLHRTTVGPLVQGNIGSFTAFGDHSRLTMVRTDVSEWDREPEPNWNVLPNILPIYRLLPSAIIVFQSDHLETWRISPGDKVDECKVEFALYSPEPAGTEKARNYWQKNYDLAIRTVLTEDFALGERMQRGFMSGLQSEVVYGRNEPALSYFHQRLHMALGL